MSTLMVRSHSTGRREAASKASRLNNPPITRIGRYSPTITNNSTLSYLPFVDMNIVAIHSGSGTVRVTNADNGKDGTSQANAALFGYTNQLGSDGLFTPSETISGRTVKFQNNLIELFTADAVVTAYLGSGAGGSSSSSSSSSQ